MTTSSKPENTETEETGPLVTPLVLLGDSNAEVCGQDGCALPAR